MIDKNLVRQAILELDDYRLCVLGEKCMPTNAASMIAKAANVNALITQLRMLDIQKLPEEESNY